MSLHRPLVTVGVPVHNGAAYLEQALDSICSQSLNDLEIVICDNASTDETEGICREYARHDPRIRYVPQPRNRGAAANYNRTVELARGTFFKWAAHDDLLRPTFLEACVRVLQQDPDVVLVHTAAAFIGPDGQRQGPDHDRLVPTSDIPAIRLVQALSNLNMVNAVFGVIRTNALRRTRLIDSFVASDYVLLTELAMLGPFVRVAEELFLRRVHPQASRVANPTDDAAHRWFTGRGRDRRAIPTKVKLTMEYLRSAATLPGSWTDRAACTAVVVPTVIWRRFVVTGGRYKQQLQHRFPELPSPA